jgi:hypothetical protein
MNRETNMPDDNERPKPEASPGEVAPQAHDGDASNQELIAKLKQGLEKTRLPADQREQILAELPPPEERERLFREMQEKGGMSFEELMESLGLEVDPQP